MKYSSGYYNFLGGSFCFGHFKICNVRNFGFFRILVGVLIDYGCFTKLPLWQFQATNLHHAMYIEQTPNPQETSSIYLVCKSSTCSHANLVPMQNAHHITLGSRQVGLTTQTKDKTSFWKLMKLMKIENASLLNVILIKLQ